MNNCYIVSYSTNSKVESSLLLRMNMQLQKISEKDCISLLKDGKYPACIIIISKKKDSERVLDLLARINRYTPQLRAFPIFLIVDDADFSSFYRVGKFPYVLLPESNVLFGIVKLFYMSGIDAIDSSIEGLEQYCSTILQFYHRMRQLDVLCKTVMKSSSDNIIDDYLYLLTELVETYDKYPVDHIRMSGRLAYSAAIKAGFSEQDAKMFAKAIKLHDLGKLFIPKELLGCYVVIQKKDDMKLFYEHTRKGSALIRNILRTNNINGATSSVLSTAIEVINSHHENYDGSGYPSGIRGNEIPFGARLARAIDMFDSLTRVRPYRQSKLSEKEAIEIISDVADTVLDRDIVRLLVDVVRENKYKNTQYVDVDQETLITY